jgi:hypothetical protein
MFKVPEKYRVGQGFFKTTAEDGNNGAFLVMCSGRLLRCIASDGDDWNHVSVSLPNRCPTWDEMSFVKNQFWGEDDTVIQFHPKKSQHINNHRFCLHLWQKQGQEHELPPSDMVGLKELNL